MPLPINIANPWKTFDPLEYVVDVKGNQRSENLVGEVETIEELEQIAAAQRKLKREAARIATNMQVNYMQVQTLLASRRAGNRVPQGEPAILSSGTAAPSKPLSMIGKLALFWETYVFSFWAS